MAFVAAAPAAIGKTSPPPQVVDPRGDSVGGRPSIDVLSVRYDTTGVGSGATYFPRKLAITMTLAAPPESSGMVSYNLTAATDRCGAVRIRFTPGTVGARTIGDSFAHAEGCMGSSGLYFPAKVRSDAVTFELPLSTLGLERGTRFSRFAATADVCDPVAGILGSDTPWTAGLAERASGDGTWVVP